MCTCVFKNIPLSSTYTIRIRLTLHQFGDRCTATVDGVTVLCPGPEINHCWWCVLFDGIGPEINYISDNNWRTVGSSRLSRKQFPSKGVAAQLLSPLGVFLHECFTVYGKYFKLQRIKRTSRTVSCFHCLVCMFFCTFVDLIVVAWMATFVVC